MSCLHTLCSSTPLVGVQQYWLSQHRDEQGIWFPRDQVQVAGAWPDPHREVEHGQHPGDCDHPGGPGEALSCQASDRQMLPLDVHVEGWMDYEMRYPFFKLSFQSVCSDEQYLQITIPISLFEAFYLLCCSIYLIATKILVGSKSEIFTKILMIDFPQLLTFCKCYNSLLPNSPSTSLRAN